MKQMREVAAQTLAVDAVTLRVIDAFRRYDIEPILLKGPSFAPWLYGQNHVRFYVDTDLLVSEADDPAARRVLTALGYVAAPVPPVAVPHATTWQQPRGGVEVDLHTRLPLTRDRVDTWRCLERHTQTMQLGRTTLRVLDDPAKALHLVIHALQNSLSVERTNTELLLSLEVVPDEVWIEAAFLAAELGAADAFAVGLSGLAPGRALAGRIGVAPSRSIPLTVRLLAEGQAESGASALDDLYHLAGWRARAVYVARKLFPSAGYVALTNDRSSRPIVNYMRYWRRILRKAPRALRVWYADCRHSRDS